jgi:putative hemolysin
MSVADCLERLMREHNHIGLVREADAKVIGMITLEDVVEELVGEIHDEFDRLPAHLIQAGEGWIAGGFVSLGDLRSTAGIQLPAISEKPIHTLNDWIVERLGHPPHGGEELQFDGCRIVVRKVRRTLVQEAFVGKCEPADSPQPDGDNH